MLYAVQRVACTKLSHLEQKYLYGTVNLGSEMKIGPHALSPLRVSAFKETVNLSSSVAPFFCMWRKLERDNGRMRNTSMLTSISR